MSSLSEQLKITEIFLSLQGEAATSGCPTAFVRLTGCPLRCTYCDTAYAFTGGKWWTIASILTEVLAFNVPYVCVTGGEPLAQKRVLFLLHALCDAGLHVSLETSGAIDIAQVDPRVSCVLDIKTPASGESARNRWENIALLQKNDQIKCVICDEHDYIWARNIVLTNKLHQLCTVWFSASFTQLPAKTLADWIVRDRLPVRFQLQLHKLLWDDGPGH